jgi:hypothetical protein
MIRKTILGIAAAAAMMGAAATSANAGVGIAIGFGGYGGGWGPGWGPGYGYGYGYGYGGSPAYDACRSVIVGYRTKKVWRYGMMRFVQVPIWRTRCF